GRPHRPSPEPPARSGGADLRPRRRHQQRQARQAVDRAGPAGRGRRARAGSAHRAGAGSPHQDVRRRGDQPPGRRAPPQDQAKQQRRHQPPARGCRHRRQRAASVREIAGGSLLPADRREARVMIATIKAEWRKNRFRPAFLVASGIMAAITILVYSVNWYLALHPLATRGGDRSIVNIATLYPDQFVNNVMGAAFPIGAAVALVVGALFASPAYGWGTVKTMFTKSPGRLAIRAAHVVCP